MRTKLEQFAVNGVPLLVPDTEVTADYEDLDAAESGRDESGVMHRIVVRHKVASWGFTYTHLTEEEKQYMEKLFPEAATFTFTHPDRVDSGKLVQTECYRSKYGIRWLNARTGLWGGYSFRIIAC